MMDFQFCSRDRFIHWSVDEQKKKKSLREPNIFLNGPFLRDSRNPEEYLMKYGSIFYKTIVFIDYFYIYFINEKKKRESAREKIPSKSIERKEIIEAYIFLYVKQFSYRFGV